MKWPKIETTIKVTLLFITLVFQNEISLAQEKTKFTAKIIGNSPFMYSEPSGSIINLKKGVEVQLIQIVDNKFKVNYQNQIGFIHKDFIKNSDYFAEHLKNSKLEKKTPDELKEAISSTELSQARFDSVKAIFKDSSYLVIRKKDWSETYFYDKPNGNTIFEIKMDDYFLVTGMVKKDFASVELISEKLIGCIYLPYFETSPELEAIIPSLLDEQNRINNEAKAKAERDKAETKKIEDQKRQDFLKKQNDKNAIARKQNEERLKVQQAKVIKERNDRIRTRYGQAALDRVLKEGLYIGMPEGLVLEYLGQPKKINKTVTAQGASEQWVYESRYCYIENSKLSSFQESY